MRVVVTRPVHDAAPWVQAFEARGHEVVQLPLLLIEPSADAASLQRAWEGLGRHRAAMFVSANAVRGFFAAGAGTAWPAGVQAWATGPGTSCALQRAGVPAAQIAAPGQGAAQYDSEALWSRVAGSVCRGDTVLIVRGAGADGEPAGRDWLARTLAAAGAQVETVVAYVRKRPAWEPAQTAAASRCAADGSAWLFSSSEAVGHLRSLLPGQDWSQARAIATHDRIAQAAREAGFAVVCLSRPDRDAVVRALESSG